jgi:hypothetical protein
MDTLPAAVETGRLVLRLPQLADAAALTDIFWDPEVVARKQVTLREPPAGIDLATRNTSDMLRQYSPRSHGGPPADPAVPIISTLSDVTIPKRCRLLPS